MKKIVAINASPRSEWNTAALVKEAAKGAKDKGAEIIYFDLYKTDAFTGCVSCFGCKTEKHLGTCIHRDGLSPILEAIRNADGLIIGSPNYLGNVTAGFRSLYERLVFQYITYKTSPQSYNNRLIPILFIMTSNCAESFYEQIGYDKMLENYKNTLSNIVGPTQILISSDTLQVNDYNKYNWTMFNPEAKKQRHKEVFPQDLQKAYNLGTTLITP